jgi:hypothetical protein
VVGRQASFEESVRRARTILATREDVNLTGRFAD